MSNESNELDAMESGCGGSCGCGGIKRRDFVAYGAVALALAALAACGVGGDGITSPTTLDTTTNLDVSTFPALANVGGVATTTIGRVPIAIVRTGTSNFSAFSRICPHQGSTINVVANGFRCPNHGATFSLSGTWTGGERTGNLRSYPAQYDATTAC